MLRAGEESYAHAKTQAEKGKTQHKYFSEKIRRVREPYFVKLFIKRKKRKKVKK